MPEGSRNEWRDFFANGVELEANAFFPLFWRAIFSADDIRHARFIDEYDGNDEASAVEREECLEEFGPDATYPYLVTERTTGMTRLAARREAVIAAIGERYRAIYEAFETLVSQRFASHILLRTRGLPDAADAEPWLRACLAEIEDVRDGKAPGQTMSDLARHDVDAVWTLAGTGYEAWPPAELRERFPDPRRTRSGALPTSPQREAHQQTSAARTPRKAGGGLDNALEWLGAVVAAGAGLGVYVLTASGWLAALAFLAAAVALGFGIVKLRGPGS
jgi:hypothetical protein